jgi:hypothetical protein
VDLVPETVTATTNQLKPRLKLTMTATKQTPMKRATLLREEPTASRDSGQLQDLAKVK